jgi:hypothetical protein
VVWSQDAGLTFGIDDSDVLADLGGDQAAADRTSNVSTLY